MAVKYVFVTGGVVSGLGKGITAASLGRLLKARGYQVTMQKFDPYINIDPGTMNPIQHGEVFVTDDGTETDLDLGHYERFIDESLDKNSNVTTGKVYWSVLQKERHGDFGGGTVQVIPHITNEIKSRFYRAKSPEENKIAIIEVGGTVGDIESQPFLEAIRQFQLNVGHDNAILIHVTLIPYLKASEELKTKPTQASVKELQGMGIQPDVLVCRSEHELTEDIKEKIALFCNVPVSHVLQNLDVEYLYEAPLAMEREKLADVVLSSLRLENRKPDLSDWEEMVESLRNPNKTVKIAIVGKYTQLHDAYLSVVEALKHGGISCRAKVELDWIDSEELTEKNLDQQLHNVDGILVPGGFGNRGTEGMILAAQYARVHKSFKHEGFKTAVVSTLYYKSTKLERAIDRLFVEVDKAFREGANILVLSDRGVDENHMPIPSLLAVSAVHQHLVKTKKSTSLAIILESGEPREVHHFATLLGYGASAINPYLALETIHELIDSHMLEKDYYAAVDDYNHAVISGIVKIASKMGISTIQSYQGSQIFEAIGISSDVIEKYFTGTVSRVGGITLEDIEENVEKLHSEAFDPLGLPTDLTLDSVGAHKMRSQGEEHRYNPQTIHLLQQSTWTGSYDLFKQYTDLVDKENHGNLRGLLDFKFAETPVPLEEVESVDDIVKRFKTGAMSYGSISQEAHETLAIAMNHLHGKSNTGEGGESDERLDSAGSSDDRCSAIKQVASGRFGVTSRYLVSAREIQIKMAQGAKPGEGGHLPAKKVYPWIAKTRHSTPGVSLISPPPHHDIYSIEDLAQLIYDLKNANKYADISVKLVSEAGVGTVAAGVAKAGAQTILISGYDGGTGAAPRSSIHNAGLPWELGLAETHQTLLKNGLRNRVRIETDGKLMSGRDVAIAALMGAEEFGFATAPLVTMGCVMMRVCNLDTCPVGVATQNPELRKRFKGKPEYVENFMRFIAQELREYMSKLGFRTVSEMVGRTDLLVQTDNVQEPHQGKVDLSAILNNPFAGKDQKVTFDPKAVYNFELEKTIDEKVLVKKCANAINKGQKTELSVNLTNIDRTFGTILGAEITRKNKNGLADDTITVHCNGAGGQSFGAFIPKGLTLELTGDSNDYFGKGLSGGKLILKVPEKAAYKAEENIIVGNVALYGATSGTAFINGVAGERFAVRNSGASAVVEGVGEHGCEYMTGGRVVVLGKTGKNFAAGMSGGIAYVLDVDNVLYKNLNKAMISIEKVENKYDKKELRDLIEAHVEATGSKLGAKVLADFDYYLPHFKKLIPNEYKKMITLSAKLEEKGLNSQQAQMEAFYESIGAKH